MKKFYCFYCQEDVKPRGFWMFRFCPHCRRHMTDDGSGFYKVCDVCEANLPTEATKCVRCGYNFNKENAVENFELNAFLGRNTWLSWAFAALLFVFALIITLGIIYISFYVTAAILLFVVVTMGYNALRRWLRA